MGYFNSCPSREHSHSFKYSSSIMKKKLGPQNLQPLWVADMDFLCPPAVIEAVKERAAHGIFGYSTMADDGELLEHVSTWQKLRLDWQVDTPWISYSPGVVNSIYYLVQALCEPGDGVIVQNPVYGPFRSVIKDAKCNWINNQMLKIQGPRGPYYQMDLEDLEKKAADPKNKILLLCSPSNPGGRVWTMEELTAVRDICHRHEVFVISDEIHGDLIFPGERHIPWGLMDSTENWAVLISPSKTFNVPGLGTSFCIIKNKKLRDQFNLIKYHNHGAMENPFGLVAAKAAYAKASPWLNELKEYLKGNYELIDRSIPDNIKLYRQEGSYLAWMDVSSMGSVKKIKEYFYEQRSLGVQLGEDFGPGGEGHVRLNFALPSRVLKEILKRIN